MTRQRWIVALSVSVLVLLVGSIFAGGWYCSRACSPEPEPAVITDGIDAGPGDRLIDQRLDAATQTAHEKLVEIDRRHAEAGQAFDDAQVQEQAALEDASVDEIEAWMRTWLDVRRDGGGARDVPPVPLGGMCAEADRWCRRYGDRTLTCADARARCLASQHR